VQEYGGCLKPWGIIMLPFHNNVAVLNGGLPEWINSGYTTEFKILHSVGKGNFIAHYKPELMKYKM